MRPEETTNDGNLAREDTLQVFSPSYRYRAGPIKSVKALGREIFDDRWRIWEAFKRDFRSNYAETVLGKFWALILPLVPIGVYVLLAQMRVVTRAEDIPFVLFICLGVTIYGMATAPIQDTIGAIRGQAALLSKTTVSVISVVLSKFGQLVWDTAVRLLFVLGIMIWLKVIPGIGAIWTLIAIIPVFVNALSIGIILGILNVIARDVSNIVGIVVRYGFFFSSVIFPLPKDGTIGQIMMFNPLNTYVVEIRSLIVKGQFEDPMLFALTAIFSMVLFIAAAMFLYRAEARIRSAL